MLSDQRTQEAAYRAEQSAASGTGLDLRGVMASQDRVRIERSTSPTSSSVATVGIKPTPRGVASLGLSAPAAGTAVVTPAAPARSPALPGLALAALGVVAAFMKVGR